MDYNQYSNKHYSKQQNQSSNSFKNKYTNHTNKTGDIFTVIANEYNQPEKKEINYNNDNYYYNNQQNYHNQNANYYNNNAYEYHDTQQHKGKKKKNKPQSQKKGEYCIDLMEIKKYLSNYEFNEKTVSTVLEMCESKLDCLICNECVSIKSEIWQCNTCFKLIHLKCIREWISKLNSSEKEKSDLKWTCPGCNRNYIEKEEPIYNCFCGKYNKGEYDTTKMIIPHSCGLECQIFICKHLNCNLPCHPGNHLSCKVIEKINCFCGKTLKEIPCINPNKRVLCNNTCEKKLFCGKHFCKVKCHDDDCINFLRNKKCGECLSEEKKKFASFLQHLEKMIFTQIQKKVNLTNVLNNYIFEGQLPCKLHHEALKTESNLKFILKLIQVSGDKLSDNIRKFIPICESTYENSCPCKNKSYDTLCYRLNYPHDLMDYLYRAKEIEQHVPSCTKICNTQKTCKTHMCNRVCCDLRSKKIKNFSLDDPNGYHICMLTCGKTLNCGIHNCTDFCHKNYCKPCSTIIRDNVVTCFCRKTKIDPPYVCGSVPKCNFECTKVRNCEHPCKDTCHMGECKFCNELTFKQCNCGKEVVKNVVCGDTSIPRCKKPCYEILDCNVHFCQEICHIHDLKEDHRNKDNFCVSICGRQYELCQHTCPRLCHGESNCNEFNCQGNVKIFCTCKINSKVVRCIDLKKVENNPESLISCNDECKKHERLKRIELAFEGLLKISQEKYPHYYEKMNLEDVKTEGGITISHTDNKFDSNMINFAKKNMKLIIRVEAIVENALKNQTSSHEITNLDKKSFFLISEFLTNYYNLKCEKSKSSLDKMKNITIKDASSSTIPRYRLSLLGLLFKNHYFVKDPNIYNPFEATILLYNYRYQTKIEEIESFLMTYCELNNFYLDQINTGKAYVHFFNKEIAAKVYNSVKSYPSQFQDCELTILQKKNEENYFKKIYSYLKDSNYYNYVYDQREDNFVVEKMENEKEKEIIEENKEIIEKDKKNENKESKSKPEKDKIDDDGFTIVKKKKNK